jgi:surfactin synthase thioesterase subunit
MTDVTMSRWLVCRNRRPNAAVRLYCFPHSGGSPGEFARWSDQLPEDEVLGVQLAGRGGRLTETPLTDVRELAVALADSVGFSAPFVFFGHSLGALVAYETARVLLDRGRRMPDQLFVSACPGPDVPRRMPPLTGLPDAELLDRLEEYYGPLGAELREDPELLALVLPAYRADFAAAESYEYVSGPPLDVPITAFGGINDTVSEDDLRAWSQHTTGQFRLDQFPGGHFYLRAQVQPLLATVIRTLRQIGRR